MRAGKDPRDLATRKSSMSSRRAASGERVWKKNVMRDCEHTSLRCTFGRGRGMGVVSTMSRGRRDFIFLNGKELKIFTHEYERKY